MKIELSHDQYRTLLELVYLGNWMVNSIKEEIDHETQRYDELQGYLFLLARDFGFGEWCDGEYEFPHGKNHLTGAEFKNKDALFNCIEKYDEYTFWEELSHKLARRDLLHKYGPEAFSKLAFEDRIKKEDERIGRYNKIFVEIGLDALKIKHDQESSEL